MASLLAVAGMVSCSSDYLDVQPETEIGTEEVGATPQGARLGMYGACRAMYSQYPNWDGYLSFNGEPYINAMYGEIMGSDFYSYMWAMQMGNDNYNWQQMNIQNGWMTSMIWRYYYGLIFKCNVVLDSFPEEIPEIETNDYNMVRAQLLTIRAHAYVKLLQFYAPRWEDSNNGSSYCMVWREHAETGDTPLVTVKDVKEKLYRDLDEAIDLYENGTNANRENIWEPDVDIARGIYSRLALIVHDWDVAQDMANAARKNYPLMTNEEYHNGFNTPEKSWLWANEGDFNGIYYWAWGSWYAANGPYPILWPYGGPRINYDLYRLMDSKDSRRDLYWTPDKVRRARPNDFWNLDFVDGSSMNMNSFTTAPSCIALRAYCEEMIPNGDKEKYGVAYASMGSDGKPNFNNIMIFFGSHFKFWGTDTYGSGSIPFMRAEELLFNEAEAAYHKGDITTAQKCLEEINKIRIDGYTTCTTTGEALLDEIRTAKRIEMWGEGFCWPDLKRWNMNMYRTAWVEGDRNSGNIPQSQAVDFEPDYMSGWRYLVPKTESDFNHAIDRSLLDYAQ